MANNPEGDYDEGSGPKTYEEICAENAGKIFYWDMDGMPVKEIYSDNGKISRIYGLEDGNWVTGFTGSASFIDNAQSVTEAEFNSLLPKNLRK